MNAAILERPAPSVVGGPARAVAAPRRPSRRRVGGFRRAVAAAVLAWAGVCAVSPAVAQKAFVREDIAGDGARLEERLRRAAARPPAAGAAPAAAEPAALRRAAELLLRTDPRRAQALAAQAAAADGRNAEGWRLLARAALAVEPVNGSERWSLNEDALAAAYLGYQRATARAEEAGALALLGRVFQRREMWRPALTAWRLSLAAAEDPGLRRDYEALRAERGFRVADYKVDSDAASPRACFEFTDPLARGRGDFSPFVSVQRARDLADAGGVGAAQAPGAAPGRGAVLASDRPETSVSAEERQVCVDGLRHGERYTVVLRQGLPSDVGEDLLRNADYDIYVRDRAPSVRFTGRNYVLPRTGQQGVPVVSVNVSRVEVEIFRIGERGLTGAVRSEDFLAQLDSDAARRLARDTGQRVWTGSLEVANDPNRDVTTAFPVLEAVPQLQPGVHVMLARAGDAPPPADPDGYEPTPRATQWFVVSDIGLTAVTAADGLHVVARSLASAQAAANVELRLLARNNEVLGTARTDARGLARFEPGLARGQGGLAPGLLTASDGRGDLAFLNLSGAPFDLTDRGVAGRPAPGALDAHVFAERGVYRSRETVHLTALLRDAAGAAVTGLPLTLVIQRPDGVEHRRLPLPDAGLGGRVHALTLPADAQPGTWRAAVHADPRGDAIGEARFLVEDYVPERIELTLEPRKPVLAPGEPAEVAVTARYLYGAPAANLEVSGEVSLQAADRPSLPGLDAFRFGLSDEPFEAVTAPIEEPATTDARGRATLRVPVPDGASPRLLQAKLALRVGENGGRAVARTLTLPIVPPGVLLGVRPRFEGASLGPGELASFDVVAASGDGARLARPGVRWTLSRLERRYQWFQQDGRWSFEAATSTRRVADGRVDVGADAPARIEAPVAWGRYRLDLSADGAAGPTSFTFEAGYAGEKTADAPDVLDVTLDRRAYAAGDRMSVRLRPTAASNVLLAVMGERLLHLEEIQVPAGGATATLAVRPEWGPNAYLVAIAHRPLEAAARRAPGRALGLASFSVDADARRLSIDLGAPAQARPRGRLDLPVRLGGLAAGEEAYVTVAAVDVGILNLTRFEAPDPFARFFGPRALGAEIRDLYGFLIDGLAGAAGRIRSGGDGGGGGIEGAPPTEAPLALFSGLVRVGPDGTTRVPFDLPAFNGTVRLMAAAWSRSRAGAAQADVVVRDPVVVTATLPRFLAPGDASRLQVDLDNVEGPGGDYVLEVDATGPVSIPLDALRRSVRLAPRGRASLSLPVAATGLGLAGFQLRLTGPAGLDLTKPLALAVRTPAVLAERRVARTLAPGEAMTLGEEALAALLPGSGSATLFAGPVAALDAPALLRSLDRYAYGCTEQTISRALPLLAGTRLDVPAILGADAASPERMREMIERVLGRQSSNGAFGLWSVGGDDVWLDAYAADFLLRAREAGHALPPRALDLTLDRLRNAVGNAGEVRAEEASGLAYAMLVLARAGRPVIGDLRYLADAKLNAFPSAFAKGQLGAALAMLGDRPRAEATFRAAVAALERPDEALLAQADVGRPDYGTLLRDAAGLLALLAEARTGAEAGLEARVVARLEDLRSRTRLLSTQETAQLLLAAQGLAARGDGTRLSLDGAPREGALRVSLPEARLEQGPVRLVNEGPTPVRAVSSVFGVPLAPDPAANAGFAVERALYSTKGERVDPARVRQGDRIVVVLTVREREARFGRLLLVDPLPAGLEIDNPSLVDGATLEGLSWLKRDVTPTHAEYRDDRFVAAIDRSGGVNRAAAPEPFALAYVVRAVSPGRYAHPGPAIEDMYKPDRFGRGEGGVVEVTGASP